MTYNIVEYVRGQINMRRKVPSNKVPVKNSELHATSYHKGYVDGYNAATASIVILGVKKSDG